MLLGERERGGGGGAHSIKVIAMGMYYCFVIYLRIGKDGKGDYNCEKIKIDSIIYMTSVRILPG